MLAFVLLSFAVYKLCTAIEAESIASDTLSASHHTTTISTTSPSTLGPISPITSAASTISTVSSAAAATAMSIDTVSPTMIIPAAVTAPDTPACSSANITDFLPAINSTDPTISPPAIITPPPTVSPDTAAWDAFVASASQVTDWTIDEDEEENEITVPTNINWVTILGQTLSLELETVFEEDEEEEMDTPSLSPSSSLVSIPELESETPGTMNFFDFDFDLTRMDTCTPSRDKDELEIAEFLATMGQAPCDRSIQEVEVEGGLTTFNTSDVRTAETPSPQPSTNPRVVRPLPRRCAGPAPWVTEPRAEPLIESMPPIAGPVEEELCKIFQKLDLRTE